MVFEQTALPQAKIAMRTKFIQFVGALGSGSRQLALDFIPPAQSVVWISRKWNLYAPLLWKMASDRRMHLMGIEYSEKNQLRPLCQTLLESQIFDTWILDGLKLSSAEGMFLHKLLKSFARPSRILILDSLPHSFCQERAHFHLSNQKIRVTWSKGRNPTPQFFSPSFLQMKDDE